MKAGRWVILAALAILTLAAGAAAQDVPLGDLARKNRKEPSKTKKVITNEEIPESPAASASSSPGGSGSGSTASDSGAPAGDAAASGGAPSGDDKAAGKQGQAAAEPDAEITEAEEEIAGIKKTEANSSKNIEKLEEMMNAEGISEFRRNMYLDAINRARGDIQTLQAQRAEKEKALAEAKEKKKKEAEAAKAPR